MHDPNDSIAEAAQRAVDGRETAIDRLWDLVRRTRNALLTISTENDSIHHATFCVVDKSGVRNASKRIYAQLHVAFGNLELADVAIANVADELETMSGS